MPHGSPDEVAAQLYALRPSDFTAARNEAADAAKASGDRDLATAIRKLGKPSAAAWAVNLLARECPDDVEELLQLGQLLRGAQDALDADDLRHLSAQRSRVVAAMAEIARGLAREAGDVLPEAAVTAVQETLRAAIADPASGEAVRQGRLTSALVYAGLGQLPAAGAVAAPRRGKTAAGKAAEQAEHVLTAARARQGATRERLAEATARRSELAGRVAALRADLQTAESALSAASADVELAGREEAEAVEAVAAAEKARAAAARG